MALGPLGNLVLDPRRWGADLKDVVHALTCMRMLLGSDAVPCRTLVVIAHPDDEVLGCGGTIAKLARGGASVKVLLPAQRPRTPDWELRIESFHRASARLGAEAVVPDPLFDATRCDTHLHDFHDVIAPWIAWSQRVFTHWHGDAHQLHRSVSRAVELATRPLRTRRDVFLFEVPSSTEQGFSGEPFRPNTYVTLDASDAKAKSDAMSEYAEQFALGRRPADLQRRLEMRGTEAGVELAEAFVAARLYF